MPDTDFMHALNSASVQQRAEQSGHFFTFCLSLLPSDRICPVENLPAVYWHLFPLDLCPTRCIPSVELLTLSTFKAAKERT